MPALRRDLAPSEQDVPLDHRSQLRLGQEVLRAEAQAVATLADRLDARFCEAAEMLRACSGAVLTCGIGKAGHVAQKVAASLASLGTPAHFLHPAEAIHGDLGRLRSGDVVLAFSFSGASEELVRILPNFRDFGVPVIAITGRADSPLARAAAVVLELGVAQEACPLGLAPSSSTTTMLALGDALALVVGQMRRFSPADFVRFHPGGSLGRQLTKVDEIMRPRDDCRVASQDLIVRQVFVQLSRPGRRTGAIMLVDAEDRLTGLFTDSDLARLLEQQRGPALDEPISQVMTRAPRTVRLGDSLEAALQLLAGRKLSELPVIDADGRPRGMLDITDVVAYLPRDTAAAPQAELADASALADDTASPPRAILPFPARDSRRPAPRV